MKKIVFFGVKTFPSRGGTDRVAENIILNLKEQYEITVHCFADPLAKNHLPGVQVVQFKQLLPGAMGSFLYFLMSTITLLLNKQAHLIHIHKTESAFFAPLLRLRYKIVSTSHEAQYKSDKWNWFARQFFYFTERLYIRYSDRCTCISKPLSNYYYNKYNKTVVFIPNGINPVTPSMVDGVAAEGYLPNGADLKKPFILFAARRLMKIKGCHFMLDALTRIGYKGQVFITGELHTDKAYMEELQDKASRLNVFFLGFVNTLPALLGLVKQASLFIFPSITEGMSIMLLEVASVGTPIIASDIPENKQVFGTNEVLYFKSQDVDDLTEKVRYALQHPNEMTKLGVNCQNKVNADYLWANIAHLYARIYDDLLSVE